MCIVGTKLDLVLSGVASRAVAVAEVEALAHKHKADLFETSAKQGDHIEDIFDCIVNKYHARTTGSDPGTQG